MNSFFVMLVIVCVLFVGMLFVVTPLVMEDGKPAADFQGISASDKAADDFLSSPLCMPGLVIFTLCFIGLAIFWVQIEKHTPGGFP